MLSNVYVKKDGQTIFKWLLICVFMRRCSDVGYAGTLVSDVPPIKRYTTNPVNPSHSVNISLSTFIAHSMEQTH